MNTCKKICTEEDVILRLLSLDVDFINNFYYIQEDLKNNKDFILKAIKQNSFILFLTNIFYEYELVNVIDKIKNKITNRDFKKFFDKCISDDLIRNENILYIIHYHDKIFEDINFVYHYVCIKSQFTPEVVYNKHFDKYYVFPNGKTLKSIAEYFCRKCNTSQQFISDIFTEEERVENTTYNPNKIYFPQWTNDLI